MSKTISYKNKNVKSAINIKYDIKNPSKPGRTWVKGKFYSYYYSIYTTKNLNYTYYIYKITITRIQNIIPKEE